MLPLATPYTPPFAQNIFSCRATCGGAIRAVPRGRQGRITGRQLSVLIFPIVLNPTDVLSRRFEGTRRRYTRGMPVISIFFGIVIRMYFREHEPKHFHAEHQAQEGKFDFDGNQLVGNITSRNALELIRQWGPTQSGCPGGELV